MSEFTDRIIDGPSVPVRGNYWRNKFQAERQNVEKKNRRIAELKAENNRLRAALRSYYAGHQFDSDPNRADCPCVKCVQYRAALAGKENEG